VKQHPLCTDPDNGPTIMDLPIAEGMKSEWAELETRRHFLGKAGKVLGWAALASLFGDRMITGDARAADVAVLPSPQSLRLPNFAPKAKRAIYLFMSGGPPQMDLLDYKPNLAQLYDKDIPDSVRGAQQLTGMTAGQARFPIAPSHWAFKHDRRNRRTLLTTKSGFPQAKDRAKQTIAGTAKVGGQRSGHPRRSAQKRRSKAIRVRVAASDLTTVERESPVYGQVEPNKPRVFW